ncbi:MAG: Hsp20/alpha crystallin family protein [Caldilineae bacterium]|nr:MAG: Hsp20/alpha crystallin family protein [Caldilineae bacterium]
MTKLVRYDPVYDLTRPFELFEELWHDLRTPFWPGRWFGEWMPEFDWAVGDNLAVDVFERNDAIVVQATLPGVSHDDIEIIERDGLLTIRAEAREEKEYEDRGWLRRERRYGAWQRTLRLPVDVKADKAKATLENGVLTIELPKARAGEKLVNRIKVSLPQPKIKLPKLGRKEKKVKVKEAA